MAMTWAELKAELVDLGQAFPGNMSVRVDVVNIAEVSPAARVSRGQIHLRDVVLPLIDCAAQTVKKAGKHAQDKQYAAVQPDSVFLCHTAPCRINETIIPCPESLFACRVLS